MRSTRVLVAVPILYALFALVLLVAVARTEPPPPDPVYGAYEQEFPIFRLSIAVVLFLAAAALWRVYRRMVDTPVLEVVGARPGPARYHGVVNRRTPVAWLTDATGSIRLAPEVFTSPIDKSTARGVADPIPGDGQEITIYGDVAMDGNGDLWLHRWTGRRLPVAWLSQGRRLFIGDGRSSVRLVAVVTGFVALSAWLMWIGVWLLQTWELSEDGRTVSAVVLPRNPARIALVSVGVGLAFLTVAGLIGMFNRLQLLRNRVQSSAAMVETFIQRRHDSIHSILAVVGASIDHQTEVLTGVELLKADAAGRQQVAAIVEQAPSVAPGTMDVLMAELVRSEDRLAAARRYYNDSVTVARTRSSTFPHVIFRGLVFRDGMPELIDDNSLDAAE